ncbi:MAG: ABC transporter substrate-binding protein [Deltaproteobacteria bacterium]|nr:ABC transporter substrate-binding protein [Deltaproteobacteria bacterium]
MVGALVAAILTPACAEPAMEPEPGVLVVSREQVGSWVRNFNPLLAGGLARWPTRGGIYEPLMVHNPAQGAWTPWLATGFTWGEDVTSLSFSLREGVRWSDGEAFTADDVVFTFDLMKKVPAFDTQGHWRYLRSVSAPDPQTVQFAFARPFVPGMEKIAHQVIVPRHVWESVEEPVSWTNPDPVATGPFTEVRRFDHQVWELGKNPNYWMDGAPKIEALRFPAIPSNEQATIALMHGEVDWAGNFIPAIDRIFAGRNPEHHRYWFPNFGGAIFLYPNHTVGPLKDARVRKALSRAIDRDKVVQVAMYDYTSPADVSGLSDGYAQWRDEAALTEDPWTDFDPAEAARLLDEAGLPLGEDGLRRGTDGQPVTLELSCITGWSDWVRAAQVIARNLQGVGLDVSVKSYDFGAWFDQLQRGEFALSIGWASYGPTPYGFWVGAMSSGSMFPIGEVAPQNWHRFSDPEADTLLAAFERTADPAEQERIAHALQARFQATAPLLPLFLDPSWGEANTTRFTGFPSAENPYSRLSPNHELEFLHVLTRIAPREPVVAEGN